MSDRDPAFLHDLNNALTVIAAGLVSVRERAGGHSEIVAELDILDEAIRRAMALAAMGPPDRAGHANSVDLADALRALAPLIERRLGPDIEVVVVADDAIRAVMDASGLDRMILNLALNARDAMPQGGRLTLGARRVPGPDAHLAIGLPPGDYVMIEVADTGAGIPADLLPHILQPGVTTKPMGEGHGLGLASVDAIIRRSGGTIAVDSAPGQGTIVRLYAPGVPEIARDLAGPSARQVLLLVEDEAALRRLAARKLEQEGWVVLAAESGEAALALLGTRRVSPDLVVADVTLPGMTGLSLIESSAHVSPACRHSSQADIPAKAGMQASAACRSHMACMCSCKPAPRASALSECSCIRR